MNIRFITPTLHGVFDYGAASALIVAPWLLDLSEFSLTLHWLSVGAGLGLIFYSLMTDYALSVARVFSYQTHLLLDLAAAVVFFVSPLVLNLSGLALAYALAMGAGVLVVVSLSGAPPHAVMALESGG